jgi:hypothetical protein
MRGQDTFDVEVAVHRSRPDTRARPDVVPK